MLRLTELNGVVRFLAYIPDGKYLVSGTPTGGVLVWDLGKRDVWQSLTEHRWLGACTVSADGRFVAGLDMHSHVWYWDLQRNGRFCQPVTPKRCQWLTSTPDARSLVLLHSAGTISVCDFASGKQRGAAWSVRAKAWHPEHWLDVSPDSRFLSICSREWNKRKEVVVWDLATHKRKAKLLHRWQFGAEPMFAPDGNSLVLSSNTSVWIWEFMKRPRVLRRLMGHKGTVRSVRFSADGAHVLTGAEDETVRLWDVATGKERACFRWDIGEVFAVAFSPDGMTAAAGGEGGIVVWDLDSSR